MTHLPARWVYCVLAAAVLSSWDAGNYGAVGGADLSVRSLLFAKHAIPLLALATACALAGLLSFRRTAAVAFWLVAGVVTLVLAGDVLLASITGNRLFRYAKLVTAPDPMEWVGGVSASRSQVAVAVVSTCAVAATLVSLSVALARRLRPAARGVRGRLVLPATVWCAASAPILLAGQETERLVMDLLVQVPAVMQMPRHPQADAFGVAMTAVAGQTTSRLFGEAPPHDPTPVELTDRPVVIVAVESLREDAVRHMPGLVARVHAGVHRVDALPVQGADAARPRDDDPR